MEHIKFAVINDMEVENDSSIEIVYGDDETYHYDLLTKYIKNKGLDKDNPNLNYADANSLALFLREQGKIVFLNKTSYKRLINSGESGIFIMTDYLSEKQKESLIEFNKYITNFEEIELWYDFLSHTECKNLYTTNNNQVLTILNYYLDEIYNKKTK